MDDHFVIRLLEEADAPAYKALRDEMLDRHPESFTSDAATDKARPAASYLTRFGAHGAHASSFTLGAWRGEQLLGAITCERDLRIKVRHIGHLAGMMVRPQATRGGIGRALLTVCLDRVRRTGGVRMVTLSVTAGNAPAIALYQGMGFRRYGSLPRAVLVDGVFHDKDLMALDLD
jgi:ribosomal protein S18 acetylase RimI-like enzyme